MRTKKKVVMGAAMTNSDIDKIKEFNQTVVFKIVSTSIASEKSFERNLIKVIGSETIKVKVASVKGKAKVVYKISGNTYIDKQFADVAEFEVAITDLEEKIKESVG